MPCRGWRRHCAATATEGGAWRPQVSTALSSTTRSMKAESVVVCSCYSVQAAGLQVGAGIVVEQQVCKQGCRSWCGFLLHWSKDWYLGTGPRGSAVCTGVINPLYQQHTPQNTLLGAGVCWQDVWPDRVRPVHSSACQRFWASCLDLGAHRPPLADCTSRVVSPREPCITMLFHVHHHSQAVWGNRLTPHRSMCGSLRGRAIHPPLISTPHAAPQCRPSALLLPGLQYTAHPLSRGPSQPQHQPAPLMRLIANDNDVRGGQWSVANGSPVTRGGTSASASA